jgi:hypothetical protein
MTTEPVASPDAEIPPEQTGPTVIFFLEPDPEQTVGLRQQIKHFGYQVQSFSSIEGIRQAATTPDVMIVDMDSFANIPTA